MAVFTALKLQIFALLYQNGGGEKTKRTYKNEIWHKYYLILII